MLGCVAHPLGQASPVLGLSYGSSFVGLRLRLYQPPQLSMKLQGQSLVLPHIDSSISQLHISP